MFGLTAHINQIVRIRGAVPLLKFRIGGLAKNLVDVPDLLHPCIVVLEPGLPVEVVDVDPIVSGGSAPVVKENRMETIGMLTKGRVRKLRVDVRGKILATRTETCKSRRVSAPVLPSGRVIQKKKKRKEKKRKKA